MAILATGFPIGIPLRDILSISIACMFGLGLRLQMTSVHDYAILWVCTITCRYIKLIGMFM